MLVGVVTFLAYIHFLGHTTFLVAMNVLKFVVSSPFCSEEIPLCSEEFILLYSYLLQVFRFASEEILLCSCEFILLFIFVESFPLCKRRDTAL